MLQRPYILRPDAQPDAFPDAALAMREPNGLLAAGGDLSTARVLAAYRQGIFPWYGPGEPILWWSPDPRCVIVPGQLHVSRRLARSLRQRRFDITLDVDFAAVIRHCAKPRSYTDSTWITSPMRDAYERLHRLGHAHSIEAWCDGKLAGGLYGIAIGKIFFGESMFSAQRDASKAILAHLSNTFEKHGYGLIDCQVASAHLLTMGAVLMPRREFLQQIRKLCAQTAPVDLWRRGRRLGAALQ